jgi:hypothetical protein
MLEAISFEAEKGHFHEAFVEGFRAEYEKRFGHRTSLVTKVKFLGIKQQACSVFSARSDGI